ncbi:hypothetical protein CH305_01530 [Rhodococcus sp. 15-649-2-2]|nr:hypothetical protein CH305_01530 [Rhodococcus sp. 15-649-2-2]
MVRVGKPLPLVLAAFEARFDEVLSPDAFERTAEALFAGVEYFLPDANWSGSAAGSQVASARYTTRTAEFLDRDRSRAVSIRPELIRLEVGLYDGHDRFRDFVSQVVVALEEVGTVASLRRVGFRTVDEISLPWSGRDPRQWKGMIAEPLLAPLELFGNSPDFRRLSGRLQFSLSDEHEINLNYGALPSPALRISPARLRTRPRKSPGGVFMIDIDSYSERSLSADQVTVDHVLKELQAPIDGIFKACVTDLYEGYHRRVPGESVASSFENIGEEN